MYLFPPWPWGGWDLPSTRKAYRDAFLRRFSATAFDVKESALAAAAAATKSADAIQRSLDGLPADDPVREQLEQRELRLREAARHAQGVVDGWDEHTRPAEEAIGFVDRALDLQVAKAGALIAFNGLVTAIALLLWPSRDLAPQFSSVGRWLFWCLLVSSLLSLAALLSWWSPPKTYESPTGSLQSSISLAAARAWAANLATGAALGAAIAVALWVWQSTPARPSLAFAPADTLRVRCTEIERTARRGEPPPGDHMTCVVSR